LKGNKNNPRWPSYEHPMVVKKEIKEMVGRGEITEEQGEKLYASWLAKRRELLKSTANVPPP